MKSNLNFNTLIGKINLMEQKRKVIMPYLLINAIHLDTVKGGKILGEHCSKGAINFFLNRSTVPIKKVAKYSRYRLNRFSQN